MVEIVFEDICLEYLIATLLALLFDEIIPY
jgi:hypothetical protein